MNMDRNVPLNLTALGFDENEDIDQITVVEAAAAVKVIIKTVFVWFCKGLQ